MEGEQHERELPRQFVGLHDMSEPVQTSTPARIEIVPTRDWEWMDTVMRNPEMYARTSHDGTPAADQLSMKVVVEDPRNAFLQVLRNGEPGGFFMLLNKAPGIYEVHTNLLPECRGLDGVKAGCLGRDFMFIHTDCRRLTSLCPEWIPESVKYAEACRFHQDFTREAYWTREAKPQGVTFVSITLLEWVRCMHRNFRDLGVRFHEQLFSQMEEETHAEDPNHDAMVGLALRLACAGQVFKAETIYNDWAAVAGYAPLRFLGERDGVLAIDIVTAVIGLEKNGNVHVIRKAECQLQQP